jgi:mannitol-1-/sugar-/sorbitol-6-phosphatase
VVTSGTRALAHARLRACGLPMPKTFVGAEDVQRGKPDPECYLRGVKLLGVRPNRCVVVEGAPSGIAEGRAAGSAVVGSLQARLDTHPDGFALGLVINRG